MNIGRSSSGRDNPGPGRACSPVFLGR